ncbi:cysteine peptidase family C39 domain-containing protein [Arthrospiribacter ruber]|uniref:VKOR family protein n=1 Tax=Arthrospiribacter ruber TaxID=2487934 RepID=A0A951J6U4_9BACT|nr:vitamin K epoxide reductase family protein [Arthrospiribacter ruber]MBW3470373.1 VKOR family protein [Arthrospiribacter ruber]
MENSFLILKKVLLLLNVPFTKGYLKDKVASHPEQESLISISDTLNHYKVDNLGLKLTIEKLEKVPLPCIIQIQENGHPFFSVLTKSEIDTVSFLDEKGKIKNISKKDFAKNWTGVTLLFEKSDKSGQPGYKEKQLEVLVFRSLLIFLGLISFFGLIAFYQPIFANPNQALAILSLFLLKAIGLFISSVLLWSEVDKDNRAIQDFCSGGKNIDCNSVTSSFSLPGGISLGIIAFAYFFSGGMLLLLTSFSGSGLQLLGYLSLSGVFIIPISIYYQWAKIRKWCVLCLWISAVLLAEILLSQIFLVNTDSVQFQDLALYFFLFVGTVVAWLSLKPYFLAKKELQKHKSKLARFLSNTEIFDQLLSSSRKFSNNPEGLGILLKGEKAKYHVLKVCNPYCGPCANSHPILEELFESGNINLQVVFHPGGEDAIKYKTISHIMAVAAQANQEQILKALDDWYLPERKEYETFAAKYPMNGELKAQESCIKDMLNWCELENISYTPTIFINGHELPKAYNIEDLKFILV